MTAFSRRAGLSSSDQTGAVGAGNRWLLSPCKPDEREITLFRAFQWQARSSLLLDLQTIGELMSELTTDRHHSAAALPEHVAEPISTDAAVEALKHGPRGALFVAAVSVSLLLVSWLAFYFLLFLPRGPIG